MLEFIFMVKTNEKQGQLAEARSLQKEIYAKQCIARGGIVRNAFLKTNAQEYRASNFMASSAKNGESQESWKFGFYRDPS